MSYQVLARKYRPHAFDEVVGQQHVLQSLEQALEKGRVHHAYLFTGTRGVGKTSLARLLVKSLNCHQGVSAHPCGDCEACTAVEAGRFVDLIEVDAASRTRVEDTRELLDNVPYMPTYGRYKVYLIDEVHMLSAHSFNALLKTLEEPPDHVKFLLATTDPDRLPVTVLSRCLQFHLRHLNRQELAAQLGYVLKKEGIGYEAEAVDMLASAASGSMRDALSLADQAINYEGGQLTAAAMGRMLGTIETSVVTELLEHVSNRNAQAVLNTSAQVMEGGKSGSSILARLAELLYVIQVYQTTAVVNSDIYTGEAVTALGQQLPPQYVQLLYQIAIKSRTDLPLAPDEHIGLDMALLRMLAFLPDDWEQPPEEPGSDTVAADPAAIASAPAASAGTARQQASAAPVPTMPETNADLSDPDQWAQVVSNIDLKGSQREVLRNSTVNSFSDGVLELAVGETVQTMITENGRKRMAQALSNKMGQKIDVVFANAEDNQAKKKVLSPAEVQQQQEAEQRDQAYQTLSTHPAIQKFCSLYNVTLDKKAITLKSGQQPGS